MQDMEQKERPQLIVQSYGKNADDIEGSFNRIVQGATWKKARVIVIIPAASSIPVRVAFSHWSLIFPPNQAVYRYLALGQEVGDAYTSAIESILDHEELSKWEYILTIEHDNVPPPDGVLNLIKRMEERPDLDVIGGVYFTKGEGGVCQRWGDPKDPVLNFRPQLPPMPGEIGECNGTGMGFTLWRLKMFKDKRLRKPWFKTCADASGVGTQDLYFWGDAKKYGFRCAIDGDVRVGHLDANTGVCW